MKQKFLLGKKPYALVVSALFLVAVLCISTSAIGSAQAYFTTYCQAKGGNQLELGSTTEIDEEFGNWTKQVSITNTAADGQPVYVRVKAFGPSTYPLTYDDGNTGAWSYGADGYYYFNGVLEPNQSAPTLNVRISGVPSAVSSGGVAGAAPEVGDNFDVAVVYETTPVQFDSNGNRIAAANANWSVILDTGESGIQGGGA